MCEWFDETCGHVLDYLEKKRLTENTLVLYLAGNGWPWSPERGRGEKGSTYEMSGRTPCMVRWPGRVEPSMNRENPVSNIDVPPTVLRAGGLEPKATMPGIDLMDRQALRERNTIFLEDFAHDIADIEHPVESLQARSCIHENRKLLLWEGSNPAELYNLAYDPFEENNLAEQRSGLTDVVRSGGQDTAAGQPSAQRQSGEAGKSPRPI